MIEQPKQLKMNSGFTLAELLVVLTIIAIIMMGIFSAYLTQGRLSANEINLSNAKVKISLVLSDVVRSGNQAREILLSQTIDGILYTTSADTLILSLPTLDENNLLIANAYDTVIYSIDESNRLIEIISAAPNSKRNSGIKILFENAQGLSFTYQNPEIINDSLWFDTSLSQPIETSNGTQEVLLSKRAALKNLRQ